MFCLTSRLKLMSEPISLMIESITQHHKIPLILSLDTAASFTARDAASAVATIISPHQGRRLSDRQYRL